jgi:thiol-disulfide isomerase/thioredoxin
MIGYLFLAILLAAPALPAQSPAPAAAETAEEREDRDLEMALAEAGSSPVEYARALERHLKKYPKTAKKAELQRVLAQAAVDARDNRRILLYGIPAIEAGLRNPQALDFVTRALLDRDDRESLERALRYSGIMQDLLNQGLARLNGTQEKFAGRGRKVDETERALARSMAFQARALGKLNRSAEAIEAAGKAWALLPSAESGFELARWLEAGSQPKEALDALAGALAVSPEPAAGANRARDLERLEKLSAAAGVSPGDALFAAHKRVAESLAARRARISALDPNVYAGKPMDHVLTSLEGKPLALTSLSGKVVVFDFWATWCGPCRAQHPLYEEVKARFKGNPDVVFLAVSTDEDRSLVAPFLEKQKWSRDVWFEDGLAEEFRINSIPTTVVLDRAGQIHSRMNGFIAGRFVDMLTVRIKEALQLR